MKQTDTQTHGHGDSMTNSAQWGQVGENLDYKLTVDLYFHQLLDFHRIGPLGRFGLVVAMSVCVSVCLFVPFPCDFFASVDWRGASHVRGLVQSVPRVEP